MVTPSQWCLSRCITYCTRGRTPSPLIRIHSPFAKSIIPDMATRSCSNQDIHDWSLMFQKLLCSAPNFPAAAPPQETQRSHPRQRRGPPSHSRKPHWWLPGVHSFSGTWTRSCGAGSGICLSEVGRPQAEAGGSGASAPGRGPRSRPGLHPALLQLLPLLLHLLCSPS